MKSDQKDLIYYFLPYFLDSHFDESECPIVSQCPLQPVLNSLDTNTWAAWMQHTRDIGKKHANEEQPPVDTTTLY